MTKLRVYEYAKQLNMSSKEIITILSRLNIPVNNHMSVMENQMVEAVEGFFSDVKARAATRSAEQERKTRETTERAVKATADVAEHQPDSAPSPEMTAGDSVDRQPRRTDTRPVRDVKPSAAPESTREPLTDGVQVTQNAPTVERPIAGREAPDVIGARSTQDYPNRRHPSASASTAQRSGRPGGRPEQGSNRPDRNSDRPFNRDRGATPNDRPAPSGDRRSLPQDRPPRRTDATGAPARDYQGTDRGAPDRDRSRAGGYNRPSANGGVGGQRPSGPPRPAGTGGFAGGPRRDNAGGNRPYGDSGARRSGDAPARSGDRPDAARRNNNRPGDRRPDYRPSGGSANSGSNSRFTAPTPTAGATSSASAGGRKRGGDRNSSSRATHQDKRENNRKLQPPRSRQKGSTVTVKAPEGPRQVTVDAPMTVGEFARMIRREVSDVIKKLLFLGMPATINQEIDTDSMVLLGAEYGTDVKVEEPRDLEAEEMLIEEEDTASFEHRPPVVTIMGHVDHGKTTLLDAIRESNVTASEAGGITQHIGAYQVEINKKKITFLDTPGHAAFTTMRARGAQITDITVLVVAADDGVMPQTIEAINHAKAANVPIIVAVNKMDKPGANPDRIKQELTEYGLVSEEWGGDTIFVPMSALQKQGIEELLEMILLVAEVGDLKASLSARSRGTVIEAQLDRGRGPVATVLVQNGTLHVGDIVVAGNTFGRVRAMVNDRGRRVKEALPSAPVEIVGISGVPSAGDPFVVYDDERQARQVAERRTMRQRAEELGATSRVTLDDLYKQIQEGEIKDLNIILKADVHGSLEAVMGALQKIDISGVRVRVIHNGVGAITESDILLASASSAIVIGFNVRPEANAGKMAESEQVDVRLYRVIYSLIEEIEAALKGLLDPVFKEVILGRAEVRQLFKVSKVGTIAGCMVQDGKIVRDADVRIIRAGVIVHEGKLESLKRFKEDAREVAFGYECGVTLERFNDLKEGDIVEAYRMEAIKAE